MESGVELRARVAAWMAEDPDPATVEEARALLDAGDEAALRDRFDARLEFGTAGLRGLLGAGPNRMNRAVVRRTTAGLCRYLADTVPGAAERGLLVGRDGRRGSDAFALETAAVALAHGFRVHFLEDYAPTPLTAFCVTELRAAAGVMITASHNPPEYNGYKVYWENGAQIIPPHDEGIASRIDAAPPAAQVPWTDPFSPSARERLLPVLDDVVQRYFDALRALDFRLPGRRDLSLVYTPLHGVGLALCRHALVEAGFTRVSVVESQAAPDGAFPTVRFPNPEEPGAMDLALELARQVDADLVLANDPDADRLAVAYREGRGKGGAGSLRLLTGNELGVLLAHHRLVDDPAVRGGAPAADRLVITTIVSSPLLGVIARDLGVRYEETLTGFKWIANRAMDLEASAGARFVAGYEEALGYTVGEVVRDKDGIGAAVAVAQLAAFLAAQGKTLGDRLDEIGRRWGVYASAQESRTYPGASGSAHIARLMEALRADPPWRIGEAAVVALRDVSRGVQLTADGGSGPLSLPRSNVLLFDLEGGGRIVARPSGTEPKIKFYFDLREQPAAGEDLAAARARAGERLERLRRDFLALVDRGSAA